MAGHFQNQQANACRLSPDGHFGSKFVTVVATGMQLPPLRKIYCCCSVIQCGDKLRHLVVSKTCVVFVQCR